MNVYVNHIIGQNNYLTKQSQYQYGCPPATTVCIILYDCRCVKFSEKLINKNIKQYNPSKTNCDRLWFTYEEEKTYSA